MKRWLFFLLLAGAAPVQAQTNCVANPASCSTGTGSIQVTMTIGHAFKLNIAPATTNLATPTPAMFDAGYAATNGPTATVYSNAGWTLGISASAATWTATGADANPAKPSTDLQWSTSSTGTFAGITTTAAPVANGAAAAPSSVTLYYRTLWKWQQDGPGTYTLQVVFTITSP